MKSISILIAVLALATSVAAQTYPSKPIPANRSGW